MRSSRIVGAAAAILIGAALASCNVGKAPEPTIDANAIYTAAARTMAAGIHRGETQTAQAAPGTPTAGSASPTPLGTLAIATGSVPFGTPFSLPTTAAGGTPLAAGTSVNSFPVGCNDATYLGETGPQDKTNVNAGKDFQKGWSLQNSGTCTWNAGYAFAFKSGDQLGGSDIVISQDTDFTDPGHSQAFIVKLTAPRDPGEYVGNWQMRAPDGTWFGSLVYFDVIVK